MPTRRQAAILSLALVMPVSSSIAAGAALREPYRSAGGLSVYLGLLPAAVLRGPDKQMHGGVAAPDAFHIVAAIFDDASGTRIENADVVAIVEGLGHVGGTRVRLDPMTIAGTVTYGGFVRFPGRDRYSIVIEIRRPGRSEPIRVEFINDHVPN